MKKTTHLIILILIPFIMLLGRGIDGTFNHAEKKAVIDKVCENLEREYIFPEITKKYVNMLKNNLISGKYDAIKQPGDFAAATTRDLMAIHKDDHLSIRYNPEWIKNKKKRDKLDKKALLRKERLDRMVNYGFEEVKILSGNIGYLKLNGFSYQYEAFDSAIAAMAFLAHTDALIVDLRANGGGSPEMVQFLCSYFIANPRKHLNTFFYKDKDKSTQYWTYTFLPGKRLDKTDLYILTSQNTFSAAEEFSYNLKHMKRATIVGEQTGGGAHDNKFVILTDQFMMSLPFARAFNRITKTNWEGVGVEPDIRVASVKALDTAKMLAAKKMFQKESDPEFKAYYSWRFERFKTLLNPQQIKLDILKTYVGTYGPRRITLEGNSLFYQRGNRPRMKMIPISEEIFMFKELDSFRLKIVKMDNQVIAVEGLGVNGRIDRHAKNK